MADRSQQQTGEQFRDHERPDHPTDRPAMMRMKRFELRRPDPGESGILHDAPAK